MTKDEALKFKMPFGKYSGEMLGVIQADDPDYLEWAWENVSEEDNPSLIKALIEMGYAG